MEELFVVLVLFVITIAGLVFMVFQKKGTVGEGYNFISIKTITMIAALLTAIMIFLHSAVGAGVFLVVFVIAFAVVQIKVK